MRTLRRALPLGLVLGAVTGAGTSPWARPQSPQSPDDTVAAELASFQVAQGYTVELYADESDGVANPVAIRWDPAGRLWVLCTWAYPQLRPGEEPDDKLLILRDSDGDGRADETTVFADGLNMPTGFALGNGGAYVGHGAELLHLRDVDGDGRADEREILFTGFGFLEFVSSSTLNRLAPSSQRATVLSVKGLGYNLGYGGLALVYAGVLGAFEKQTGSPGEALLLGLPWQAFCFAVTMTLFFLFFGRTGTRSGLTGGAADTGDASLR